MRGLESVSEAAAEVHPWPVASHTYRVRRVEANGMYEMGRHFAASSRAACWTGGLDAGVSSPRKEVLKAREHPTCTERRSLASMAQ
jgi:hypothetical protein